MLSWLSLSRSSLGPLFAVLLFLQSAPAGAELDEDDYRQMVAETLEGYLRPALRHFVVEAEAVQGAVAGLCAEPSSASVQIARIAFAEAATAWAAVEYIDLDPWLEDNRGTRIYFFPDRRGVTGRHLRAALQKADPVLLTEEAIAQSSVALQGLPALEYLLFGKGSDVLTTSEASGYRCAMAEAVAGNLVRLAANLGAAWAPGAGFPSALADPRPDNAFVRTHKEAATLLLGRLTAGMEAMNQRKVSAPLGRDFETARPLRAAYALSGLTNPALAANIKGFRSLYEAAGLEQRLDPGRVATLEQAYARVFAALNALQTPLGAAAADPAGRADVIALQAELRDLHRLAALAPLSALGLKVFFSADDGD